MSKEEPLASITYDPVPNLMLLVIESDWECPNEQYPISLNVEISERSTIHKTFSH